MILLDPILKLEFLREYMFKRIDGKADWPFEKWLKWKHPKHCYGTAEYYKSVSTNCFYCRKETGHLSVDHFHPQSRGIGNEYKGVVVISCVRCNCFKDNLTPDRWIRKMTRFKITGYTPSGFSPKDIRRISDSVNEIQNDYLLGRLKSVYYRAHKKNKVPKGFLKVV